ncbi:MAG: class I SAM-dependent methyltransferase [Clostridiales Family XIII bacterium]|nr:class I SAM-dependent methyltransferase [Clostridiales Family XIII bacterium]
MFINYIGHVALSEENAYQYLIISENRNDFNALSSEKTGLFAVGKLSDALSALGSIRVKPQILCNSDSSMKGRNIFGYSVVNTWEIINQRDLRFIIPVTSEPNRNAIVRQLLLNDVIKYSFLYEIRWPDFERMPLGTVLRDNLLQSMNKLVNNYIEDDYKISELFWHYTKGVCWWNKIYEWVFADITGNTNVSILDIGPGIGLFSAAIKGIANVSLDIVDVSPHENDCLANMADTVFVADVERDDLTNIGKYDLIVMTEVIEHFSYNPVPTLIKIGKHLCEGGVFYLSCPHWSKLASYVSWEDMPSPGTSLPFVHRGHTYEFSHAELLEICTRAGFDVIREGFSASGNSNLALRVK